MRLYLIRHPQPDIAKGICYGATDLPVVADEINRVLVDLDPQLPRRAPIFSSVLQRCALLAEQIASRGERGPVTLDARLVEMNFGRWEMQSWEHIARSEIDAWAQDLVGYQPGVGENVYQVAQRVMNFLHDLQQSGSEEAIVVCHAGTIRLLSAYSPRLSLREIALRAAVTPHQVAFGGLVLIDC